MVRDVDLAVPRQAWGDQYGTENCPKPGGALAGPGAQQVIALLAARLASCVSACQSHPVVPEQIPGGLVAWWPMGYLALAAPSGWQAGRPGWLAG